MKFENKKVTPEDAKKMLEKNTINRSIAFKRVQQYATDMKNGKWQNNGEAIKFDRNGRLVDGQHRLSAIVMSGATVEMTIVHEIDTDISLFDRGRNRNVTDSLVIEGMDKSIANNTSVGIAKLSFYMHNSNTTISDAQVKDWLYEHQEAVLEVVRLMYAGGKNKTGRVKVKNSPIGLALIAAIENNYPLEKLERWASVVKTGFINDFSEQAAIVFRNDLLSGAVDCNKNANSRRKAVYQTEKSIQDFVEGRKRKMSYSNWDQPVYSNY